jgi:endonuclease G
MANHYFSIKLIYLLVILFFSLFIKVSAQSTGKIWHQIDSLYKQKVALQTEIENIQAQSEALKLERIQIDLKKYALPKCDADNQVVYHSAMVLGYNDLHEQANWVAHIITKDIMEGTIGRTNDFRVDSLVQNGSANTDDYWDSGYDRGHLAPSADFRWSKKALSESYFYSNMSPQVPEFNREIWADLEGMVRKWAIDNEEVMVVTGPILRKGLPTIGDKNKISIPEYYYKIVLDNREPEVKAIAFLIPNKGMKQDPMLFAVSVDSVEKMSGIDFFPSMPDDLEKAVEANFNKDKWNLPVVLAPAPTIELAKGQVSATDSKHYIGNRCTVCGTVVSTRFTQKTGATYLNLDYNFPNQVFTLVIKGEDRVNFSYIPEIYLKNKQLCVRGLVEEFNGTPQMIIKNEKKLKIIEAEEEK